MVRTSWMTLVLLALGCTGTGESLNAISPSLRSDQARVVFPDADVGVMVEALAGYSNPTGGVVHFQAHLEPSNTALVLVDLGGSASPDRPARVRLALLAQEPGRHTATLVVDHDGAPGPDGSRTLRTPVEAFTRPPPDCNDHNPCTLDAVDLGMPGGCSHQAMEGQCDDASACTTADRCVSGVCMGDAVVCDDGVACTMDRCDPVLGCTAQPSAALCDDADPCTVDVCAPEQPANGGCTNALAPNGTLCGAPSCATVAMCVAGACTTLPTPEGYPCDDGDACSVGDACRAGSCVAGTGGRTQSGGAVLVTDLLPCDGLECGGAEVDPEFPQDPMRPLGGYWPVALDGLEPLDATQSLLVWHGAAGPGAPWCYNAPDTCHQLSGCTDDAQGTHTALLATTVDQTGYATQTHQMDFSTAYASMALAIGLADGPSYVPDHSVLSVSTVVVDHRVLGAALVTFANGCEACVTPRPTPPAQDEEEPRTGGAQRPPCLPAGVGLVVFEVNASGFTLWTARWLGPHFESSAPPLRLVTLASGAPLLTTAVIQDRLGVAWAHVVGCSGDFVDCDAEDSAVAQVLHLNAGLTPGAAGPQLMEMAFDVPGNGEQRSLTDVSLQGPTWVLQWTQPSSTVAEPPVNCFPTAQREAWGLSMDGSAILNPFPLSGLLHARLPVMDAAFEWTRVDVTMVDDGSCSGEDVFSWAGLTAVAVPPVRIGAPAHAMLTSARAQNLSGGPTVLGTSGVGQWVVAPLGLTPQVTQLDISALATGAWMATQHAPLGAMDALGGLHLGGMAELGGDTNRAPMPALAISATRCVAGGPVDP